MMDNPSAPPGKAHKYARIERERCWRLGGPPDPATAIAIVEVTDIYFPGTRLRLRRMVDTRDGAPPVYKLTQKVPGPDHRRLTTNTYLSEAEYDLLSQLGGHRLTKLRYSVPPFGIDVFPPPLDGLVLAEMEYDDDEAMAAGTPPNGAVAEVTGDVHFTGGHLAASVPPRSG
jgi:CYTH domain-containing protein